MKNRKETKVIIETKQAILWLLCISAGMYIIGLCMPGCEEFNREVQEGLETDPRTPSRMMNWDTYMDSVDMRCGGEWHGREGESQYGEYESR